MATDEELQATDADTATEEKTKLSLDVKIETKSSCERHVVVTVSRDDINRYVNKAYSELMPKALVPGFRAGRAPRKLVESKFRKDIVDQVKGELIVDALAQVSEDHELAPISEPDFDPTAVTVPDDGPLKFEFDIEVRPDFDVPEWKGLKIEKPVKVFGDADVDQQLRRMLEQNGKLVPHDGPAGEGDYLVLNLAFKKGDDEISSVKEETIRVRPVLSFRDGKIENFDKLMIGSKAGDKRSSKAKLSDDAPNQALRGQEITAEFEILEVKKLELPELDAEMLQQLGDFETVESLRDTIRKGLERRLEFAQQQRAREQILEQLTVTASWDLPPNLLKRQARRELDRMVLELKRSGFSDDEIRAYGNELMQNSKTETARALKEHFILERIAESEKIEDDEADYDEEIRLIAEQSNESPRRVRAQIEKKGLLDALRNQIIERKTLAKILDQAAFKEVPYLPEGAESAALDRSAGGGDEPSAIPEAQADSTPASHEQPRVHP